MKFAHIFDVFSRRQPSGKRNTPVLPDTFRNRILLLCRDTFGGAASQFGQNVLAEFWAQVREVLLYRHGKMALTPSMYQQTPAEDAIPFLLNCADGEFLDFIEYIFRVSAIHSVGVEENDIVDRINELLAIDNIGLELTHLVEETTTEEIHDYPFRGRVGQVTRVVAYPKVILKEDEVLHGEVITPTLAILSAPALKAANLEFLGALEDYRKGDFGDALTKAASSLESTMKVICSARGWTHSDNATASDLIRIIIARAPLESFFEQPLIVVASLRNRLSTSHGGGLAPRTPSSPIARYCINATASAICFLAQEVGGFPAA